MLRRLIGLCVSALVAGCVGPTIPALDMAVTGRSNEQIPYAFSKPDGAGPFPAVVLLHGCGGWHGGNIGDWARWYRARGFATLALDSFTSRGLHDICDGRTGLLGSERLSDAYGALRWLRARPDIKGDDVIVMGFSHGAGIAIEALTRGTLSTYPEIGEMRFRAGVAFYPYCRAKPEFYAPILVVVGSLDDWTPAFFCDAWKSQDRGWGEPATIRIIEGATHTFDAFTWRGRQVGARTTLGHRLVPSKDATKAAEDELDRFLENLDL